MKAGDWVEYTKTEEPDVVKRGQVVHIGTTVPGFDIDHGDGSGKAVYMSEIGSLRIVDPPIEFKDGQVFRCNHPWEELQWVRAGGRWYRLYGGTNGMGDEAVQGYLKTGGYTLENEVRW